MVTARPAYVLGGGVAGLVAAFGLAARGFCVVLFESRRQLGGRAFSTVDPQTGERLDNGAHVMLGCYDAMGRLLRQLGTDHLFARAPSLCLRFRWPGGRTTGLALPALPVPVAMPLAVARLGVSWRSRARLLLGMLHVLRGAPADWSVAQWLERRRQHGAPEALLWRPLCRAIMNAEPAAASAADLLAALRQAFTGGAAAAAFWLPLRPWGEALGDAAPAALARAGVTLHTGARVTGWARRGDRIAALELNGDTRIDLAGDALVVCALPWFALQRLLGAPLGGAAPLASSPIVTAYFSMPPDEPALPDDGPVAALVDGEPFHFVLRRPGEPAARFALLSGGDRSFDGQQTGAIAARARAQLGRYYPGLRCDGAVVRIRKEQHATFVAAPGSAALRPPPGPLPDGPSNLWVCGDWTNTGLPATLEGAARSAEALLRALDRRDGGAAAPVTRR